MLELKNVKKIYKTKSGSVTALDGLSLKFPSKGMIFISGKSGCGKTTLLNVIGGLDAIDEGEISLYGKPFSGFGNGDYDDYRNTFVGFIFQEYNLLGEFSVEKNIRLALELQGKTADEEELESILKDMDIWELRHRKPSELSGGQRQRVAIARALIKHPSIIMADEPTGALDSNTGVQVLDILKKLSEEKLVIIVSHDKEFAEKYADRVIRLVDGKVSEDITYTQNVFNANIREKEDALLIREGSDLTDSDKNAVACAVKERKKIEVIKELSFREHNPTEGEKIKIEEKELNFTKSKIKFSSVAVLGLKSLGVKPFRLVFTILLSAIAFAVFGLFDTLANFSTKNIMNYLLRNSETTVSAYGEYITDKAENEYYDVRFSADQLDKLAKETGYTFKGIYDAGDLSATINRAYTIEELVFPDSSLSECYYSRSINGFIEFSPDEIKADGSAGAFGYKLVDGRYPKLVYDEDGKVTESSMQEVAISVYTADSMLYFLNGYTIGGDAVTRHSDLIDKEISLHGETFKIVGIVDCGKIPAKYEILLNYKSVPQSQLMLAENFAAFINSGAQKCLFFPEGRAAERRAQTNVARLLYGGDATWSVTGDFQNKRNSADSFVYSSEDYGEENILLFSDDYGLGVKLKDNEVLIHAENLSRLFRDAIMAKKAPEIEAINKDITFLCGNLKQATIEEKREALNDMFRILGLPDGVKNSMWIKLYKRSEVTYESTTQDVKIVGVYVGVDTGRSRPTQGFRFMMPDALLDHFGIYGEQGEYSRFIFDAHKNYFGTGKITDYMLKDNGVSLIWYANSSLDIVRMNESLVRQGADLFLYAALALAVFSIFMLFNYIATSIVNKRRSIGVLRGLGSGSKALLLMFLIESVVIALVSAVLASAVAALGCVLVNWYILNVMNITIPFALFSIRQVAVIFALSLLTAFVSSIIPIVKICREKPVDLIGRP